MWTASAILLCICLLQAETGKECARVPKPLTGSSGENCEMEHPAATPGMSPVVPNTSWVLDSPRNAAGTGEHQHPVELGFRHLLHFLCHMKGTDGHWGWHCGVGTLVWIYYKWSISVMCSGCMAGEHWTYFSKCFPIHVLLLGKTLRMWGWWDPSVCYWASRGPAEALEAPAWVWHGGFLVPPSTDPCHLWAELPPSFTGFPVQTSVTCCRSCSARVPLLETTPEESLSLLLLGGGTGWSY